MFRSIVIGLGSMCLVALIALGAQNWDQLPKPDFSNLSLPSFSLSSADEVTEPPVVYATKAEVEKSNRFLAERATEIILQTGKIFDENAEIRSRLKALEAIGPTDSGSQLATWEERLTRLEAKVTEPAGDQNYVQTEIDGFKRQILGLQFQVQSLAEQVLTVSSDETREDVVARSALQISNLLNSFKDLEYSVEILKSDIKILTSDIKLLEIEVEGVQRSAPFMVGTSSPSNSFEWAGMIFEQSEVGVKVSEIDSASEAYEKGIRKDFTVVEVARVKPVTLDSFPLILDDQRSKGRLSALLLVRDPSGDPRFLNVQLN